LQKNKLNESIAMFTEVLSPGNKGYLGIKYEAATHFNLGVAYLRINNHSMATVEFNSVLDTWPVSMYARRAQEALERLRGKNDTQAEDKPADQ
jgi:hypothetical protein